MNELDILELGFRVAAWIACGDEPRFTLARVYLHAATPRRRIAA